MMKIHGMMPFVEGVGPKGFTRGLAKYCNRKIVSGS